MGKTNAKWMLLSSLLVVLLSCKPEDQKDADMAFPDRPNILWLVAEDLSPEFLPMYGDSTVRLPNIERLAREGMLFTHLFDVSGVCAPSRSAIATGMYPISIGTHHMRTSGNPAYIADKGLVGYSPVLPPQVRLHGELMRQAGYYTTNNAKEDYQVEAPVTVWSDKGREAHWRKRPDPAQPFFSIFNFEICHESGMWRNVGRPLAVSPDKVRIPPIYPDTPIIREQMARMYSNIVVMDSLVGTILSQLEADGLLEKTIIFWYSDNGGPLPRYKRELYETGIHIPMVVRFPNQQNAGSVNDEMASFVDFAPTLLSLAGLPAPDYMQGQAFLGAYKATNPRQYVYAARDRMDSEYDIVRAVRDRKFKYLRNYEPEKPYMQNIKYRTQMPLFNELVRAYEAGELNEVQSNWFRKTKDKEELFDVVNDPYEQKNLANDPQYAEELARLRKAMDDWQQQYGDLGLIPELDMIQRMWPDLKQPITEMPDISAANGQIALSCPTDGASIAWQVGDTLDMKHWQVYLEPITVPEGKKLFTLAHRIGFKASEVVTWPME